MATGRLASASIAAGGSMQLYTNNTDKVQMINLFASSQVSGKAPKLSVKIATGALPTPTTTTVLATNHSFDVAFPSSLDIAGEGETSGVYNQGAGFANDVTKSGSRLYLSPTLKDTAHVMGQAWSPGYHVLNQQNSDTNQHPWSKVAFDGQPQCVGGSGGGKYRYSNAGQYGTRYLLNMPDPYYLENPNAYNQNKARWIVNDTGSTLWHVEDISKMPTSIFRKYFSGWEDWGSPQALSDGHSRTIPDSGEAWGTVTARGSTSGDRGQIYDEWTGLHLALHNSGYVRIQWWDENSIATTTNPIGSQPYYSGTNGSNSGIFRWSHHAFQGSDPFGYDGHGHGSVYGTFMDMDHGLICCHSGHYHTKLGFKYMGSWFVDGTLDNKDTRAAKDLSMNTFSQSSYYHTCDYTGSGSYFKLQWVKYNPNTSKYYVCLWDNSGSYSANPVPTMGTSYASESGIFEVDVTKIRGQEQSEGNTYSDSFAANITAGILTKVASVPDTVSGLMSRPVRLKASLWTAHCQNGKQYFSSDLITWAEKSSTYILDAYQMVNIKGTGTEPYYIAASSKDVVFSSTGTVTESEQVALAGLIAKGAVTPYDQKGILLSKGDFLYIDNEDDTDAITIHAMGVDV